MVTECGAGSLWLQPDILGFMEGVSSRGYLPRRVWVTSQPGASVSGGNSVREVFFKKGRNVENKQEWRWCAMKTKEMWRGNIWPEATHHTSWYSECVASNCVFFYFAQTCTTFPTRRQPSFNQICAAAAHAHRNLGIMMKFRWNFPLKKTSQTKTKRQSPSRTSPICSHVVLL